MNTTNDALPSTAQSSIAGGEPAPEARLRVRVGVRELCLPLSALAGVADCPPLAQVPGAPAWLYGVGGLHGRLLPVADLTAAEGSSVLPDVPGPKVLLVEVRGQVIGFSASEVSVETDKGETPPDFDIQALAAGLLADAVVAAGRPGPSP